MSLNWTKTTINNQGNDYYKLYPVSIHTAQWPLTTKQHQTLKTSLSNLPAPLTNNIRKIIDPDRYAMATSGGFVWVPTEFVVNNKGKVEEISHIEHVSRVKHPDVYESIGCIFEAMLPTLCEVMNFSLSKMDDKERKHLSVIVKAQQFEMDPGSNYEGYWHKEGFRENIAGVGLYYYDVGNTLTGSALRFRPQNVTYYFCEPVYSPQDDAVIPIQEGTAIVFSNSELVHKCSLVENTSKQNTAKRGYVAFFVVDTVSTPLTTKKLGCRSIETAALVLDRILGHCLPLCILEMICEFAGWGCVTLEEQNEAIEILNEQRLMCKQDIEETSGDKAKLGFSEGWNAMDGGVMGFGST